MNKLKQYLNDSFKSLASVRNLVLCGMLLALACLLELIIISTPFLKFTLSTYPRVIAAYICGPVAGGIVGALTDIVSVIINPKGPYFPGFTVDWFIAGVIYGLFLYKREPKPMRVAMARLTTGVLCDLILRTTWLVVFFNLDLNTIFTARLLQVAFTVCIDTIVIYGITRLLHKTVSTSKHFG